MWRMAWADIRLEILIQLCGGNLVRFFETPYPERDVHGILKEGIRKVNRDLYECTSRDPKLNGAGSTLVLATIKGSVLYVANIGDSRLYLLREALEQITKDHSYVEELVAMGKLKRGSRDYLEKKNIITRAVGVSAQVDTDLFALKLKSGDQILMCSDGLSNMVDELEIEYIIRSEDGVESRQKPWWMQQTAAADWITFRLFLWNRR